LNPFLSGGDTASAQLGEASVAKAALGKLARLIHVGIDFRFCFRNCSRCNSDAVKEEKHDDHLRENNNG
jgi:hypothetical protein